MPDIDLDTEAALTTAGARIVEWLAGDDRRMQLDVDTQRWLCQLAYAALLRIPAPTPTWTIDDRSVPAWLAALPDPQQES